MKGIDQRGWMESKQEHCNMAGKRAILLVKEALTWVPRG